MAMQLSSTKRRIQPLVSTTPIIPEHLVLTKRIVDVAKMCALERRRSLPTKNLQRRQGAMCFSSVEIPELADLNDFTGKVAPAKKALQTSKLMFLHEINMKAFQKLRDSVTSAPPLEAGELRYTTQQIDSMESTYLNGLNDYELEGQLAVAEDYATSAFGIDPEKLLDPNGARLVKPPESPDIDSGIRLPNDSPNLPDQSSERLDNTVNSAQLRTPTLIAGDVNINSGLAKRYQEATDTWAQTETTWQAKVRSAEKALENRAGMKPGEMEGILKNVGQDGVDVPLADQKAPMQIKVQGDSIIVKGLPTPKAGKILLAAALPAAVVGGAIAQVVSDNST